MKLIALVVPAVAIATGTFAQLVWQKANLKPTGTSASACTPDEFIARINSASMDAHYTLNGKRIRAVRYGETGAAFIGVCGDSDAPADFGAFCKTTTGTDNSGQTSLGPDHLVFTIETDWTGQPKGFISHQNAGLFAAAAFVAGRAS